MNTLTADERLETDRFHYSKGMGKKDMEKLFSGNATFKNCQFKDSAGKSVIGGVAYNPSTNEWELNIPAGTPSDLVGQAVCDMKQKKSKEDTRQRLLAKLAAKKK